MEMEDTKPTWPMARKEMIEFSKQSFYNREGLELHGLGTCYCCFREVQLEEIEEWTDRKKTAICPNCCLDAIIPGKVEKEILVALNSVLWQKVPTKEGE